MARHPADEDRHEPGSGPWWSECWGFELWDEHGLGAYSVLVLLPNQGRAWYWAAVVRPDHPLLSVVDQDQALPVGTLRVRGGGLWADAQCEAPFEQWTVLNETYAVALDDPDDALGRALGEPAPVAFDWEWYASSPPADLAGRTVAGYAQAGQVLGEIELRDGRVPVDARSMRVHWWGDKEWFGTTWGSRVAGVRAPLLLRGPAGERTSVERVLTTGGWHEWGHPAPS
ncbi:MAG TPA: hypothetical protein VF855_09345 [Acidimicrobiales bacterium]